VGRGGGENQVFRTPGEKSVSKTKDPLMWGGPGKQRIVSGIKFSTLIQEKSIGEVKEDGYLFF